MEKTELKNVTPQCCLTCQWAYTHLTEDHNFEKGDSIHNGDIHCRCGFNGMTIKDPVYKTCENWE